MDDAATFGLAPVRTWRRGIAGDTDTGSFEGDLETTYRTLLEQIPAIVYVWGVNAGLEEMVEEYVSPQIEAVLGFRTVEWMADPNLWIRRLHPDDRAEVIDETTRSVEAGEPFKLEYRMIARDGRVVWLHDVASVVARDVDDRAIRYQGVQLDITARKNAEHAERRAHERLRQIDQERRALVGRVIAAQDDERRRISEGIHDQVMQDLFGSLQRLYALRERPRSDEDVEDVSAVVEEIARSITALRNLAFDLHPRLLHEGLEVSLRSLIERFADGHPEIHIHLGYRLKEEPTGDVRLALYRTAQETISNALRHGGGTNVTVRLEDQAGGMILRVEDDGSGFAADAPTAPVHLGLASIRERTELLGGWFRVVSEPRAGAIVECWLPTIPRPANRGSGYRSDRPDEAAIQDGLDEAAGGSVLAPSHLTPREGEVAALLALGHTNAEISRILHLSIRTIEHHRARIFRKLGVRSRAGVVRALAQRGDTPSFPG